MERLTKYICDRAHGAEGVSAENLTGSYCRGAFEATAIVERLSEIEDILGDDYDLERLSVMMNQCMSMRDEVQARFRLTAKIPLDRLKELVEADRDGRCVVLPCKVDDEVYVNIMGKTLPFTVISISQITETPTYKAMHGVQLCFIFKSWDVGKTVFLTREAAEAALKGEQDGKHL